MKKLFISCPMKGRTEENIKKSMEQMHKIAEVIFDQELEVISSYIDENAPDNCNADIWYLSKSVELMAGADYFIGILYSDYWRGCNIEADVARYYGIRSTYVDVCELMPDANEIAKNYYVALETNTLF